MTNNRQDSRRRADRELTSTRDEAVRLLHEQRRIMRTLYCYLRDREGLIVQLEQQISELKRGQSWDTKA